MPSSLFILLYLIFMFEKSVLPTVVLTVSVNGLAPYALDCPQRIITFAVLVLNDIESVISIKIGSVDVCVFRLKYPGLCYPELRRN